MNVTYTYKRAYIHESWIMTTRHHKPFRSKSVPWFWHRINPEKAQTQENPSQIKQIKKDYHDFMEKYKKEMKEKDEKLEEMTKKVFEVFQKRETIKTFRITWQNREVKLFKIKFEF